MHSLEQKKQIWLMEKYHIKAFDVVLPYTFRAAWNNHWVKRVTHHSWAIIGHNQHYCHIPSLIIKYATID